MEEKTVCASCSRDGGLRMRHFTEWGAALQAERGKTPAAAGLAVPETAGVLPIRLL